MPEISSLPVKGFVTRLIYRNAAEEFTGNPKQPTKEKLVLILANTWEKALRAPTCTLCFAFYIFGTPMIVLILMLGRHFPGKLYRLPRKTAFVTCLSCSLFLEIYDVGQVDVPASGYSFVIELAMA